MVDIVEGVIDADDPDGGWLDAQYTTTENDEINQIDSLPVADLSLTEQKVMLHSHTAYHLPLF